MRRCLACACLAATATALRPTLAPALRSQVDRVQRTRALIAQQQQGLPAGWTSRFDQTSQSTYYVNDQTGESQWEQPQTYEQPQSEPQWEQPYQAYAQSSSAVLWHMVPCSGVRCYVHSGVQPRRYEMRNGDVQVLSRFSMLTQKLTVSRAETQRCGAGAAFPGWR